MLSLHTTLAFAVAFIAQFDGSDTTTVPGPPSSVPATQATPSSTTEAPSAPEPTRTSSIPPAFETPVSAARQWDSYRSVLALNLGLGSAVGILGGTYALSLASFLETEVGVGIGFTGTQYSLMQKVILRDARHRDRFVAGVGVAYAYFEVGSVDPQHLPVMQKSGSSVWLNLDLAGWEIRAANHFVFFVAGGLAIGLAGGRFAGIKDDSDCSPVPDCRYGSRVPGYVTPQLRTGLGVWF